MSKAVKRIQPLTAGVAPWSTLDPFLFCVHHHDLYPASETIAPDPTLLRGRQIGHDFEGRDGWRMYHGDTVPGFPQHPHRGFETITIVKQGYVDHFDSLGANGRIGPGDVQWMTAGKGIQHCEMFPLVHKDKPNTCNFFQLWLNLPRADKMIDPNFTMYWAEQCPTVVIADDQGIETSVQLYAGTLNGVQAPPPPPNSWASREEADIAIWTIRIAPGGKFVVPPAKNPESNRCVYYFDGKTAIAVETQTVRSRHQVVLDASVEALIHNTSHEEIGLLLLQGRKIGEPVAQHGPFVMNTMAEIEEAFSDYRRTQFGGWPYKSSGPTHPRDAGRFAKHVDGRIDRPTQ